MLGEMIIKENSLDKKGFDKWLFTEAMLFKARYKWWGNKGLRLNAHEGVDLAFYINRENDILNLDKNTKIPAFSDGKVVNVIDDFLGRSLFLKIDSPDENKTNLLIIYGHTAPLPFICAGTYVKKGEIIATIANTPKSTLAPHLHISAGVDSGNLCYENLNWNNIENNENLNLIDPLKFVCKKEDCLICDIKKLFL